MVKRASGAGPGDDVYDVVSEVLERHDPMGIMPDEPDPELGPQDEYDPEATSIAARLAGVGTRDEVRRVVVAEFERWFEDDAPPPEVLGAIADDIHAAITGSRGDG